MDNGLACDELTDLISAYVDGELSNEDRAAVAGHIDKCPDCAQMVERTEALRRWVRQAAQYEVPAHLPERVRRALPAEGRRGLYAAVTARRFHLVASHVFAACVGALALFVWQADTTQRDLNERFVSAHIRKLLDGDFSSVDSSDSHTVRPWFAGKIDFAPPVIALDEAGFALTGAYIDYVNSRAVAALNYRRRQHRITLFICPLAKQAEAASVRSNDRGYHVMAWHDERFAYRAVSDLNPRELNEFSERFRDNTEGTDAPTIRRGE